MLTPISHTQFKTNAQLIRERLEAINYRLAAGNAHSAHWTDVSSTYSVTWKCGVNGTDLLTFACIQFGGQRHWILKHQHTGVEVVLHACVQNSQSIVQMFQDATDAMMKDNLEGFVL